MFYERNINGEWVSGDGVVYADFDLQLNTITKDEMVNIPMKNISQVWTGDLNTLVQSSC